MQDLLSGLPPEESELLQNAFGLCGKQERTLEELAESSGLSCAEMKKKIYAALLLLKRKAPILDV